MSILLFLIIFLTLVLFAKRVVRFLLDTLGAVFDSVWHTGFMDLSDFLAPAIVLLVVFVKIVSMEFWLNEARTNKEMVKVSQKLEEWRSEKGKYPEDLDAIVGTRPLRKTWYTDNWGNYYSYQSISEHNSFVLVSAGSDGRFGTSDDLVVNGQKSSSNQPI